MKKKVLLAALCLVLAYGLVWGANFLSYGQYVDGRYAECPGLFGTYVTNSDETEYSYLVAKPQPFEFTGCLSSNNAGGTIGIIAWPKLLCRGDGEYGLVLYEDVGGGNMEGYLFYVHEDMSIDTSRDTGMSGEKRAAAMALYSACYPQIMEQYRAMREMFHLT